MIVSASYLGGQDPASYPPNTEGEGLELGSCARYPIQENEWSYGPACQLCLRYAPLAYINKAPLDGNSEHGDCLGPGGPWVIS
jgi:hypothetical protein